MLVPYIGGQPLHLWLGLLLLIMIVFQGLTGKRILKLPFSWHRYTAILILITALIHAYIAVSVSRF